MKRLMVISLLLVVAACGCEASYQGKSVTAWRKILLDTDRGDDEDRADAAHALSVIGPKAKAAIPDLITVIDKRETYNDPVRLAALSALRSIGAEPNDVLDMFIKILQDNDEPGEMRREAAAGLGDFCEDSDKPVRPLIAALKDEDPQVRDSAVKSLHKYESNAKEAVPSLIQLLKDSEANMRAARTKLDNMQMTPQAYKDLENWEVVIRTRAVYVLKDLGRDASAAVPLLKEMQDREWNGDVRQALSEALGNIAP